MGDEEAGRTTFTRTIDRAFVWIRNHLPPIHWLGASLTAMTFFLYIRLVALTARLATTGEQRWPDVPARCILALWHRDAPALLAAFAKRPPHVRTVIMIARDPRGDYIALLCQLIGLEVVRGDNMEGGWNALVTLSEALLGDACVIITADGGGPARSAKVGAVALASAVAVPLIPLAADCCPAIEERHKWDRARNPVPFCRLTVAIGKARSPETFTDRAAVEESTGWLEASLNELSGQTRGRSDRYK